MGARQHKEASAATEHVAASTPKQMWQRHIVVMLLITIAVSAAYANSLNGTWALDDVVANKPVSIKDIGDFVGFRKVAYITFIINQRIAPFSPVSFRVVNILIHLAATGLVYVLAYKTLIITQRRQSDGLTSGPTEIDRQKDLASMAALIGGVLFALHPININAVAYIVQRMASLAAFFALLSLLFYVQAAETSSRTRSLILNGLCIASLILGVLSKENAIVAVPLILLYHFEFLSSGDHRTSKHGLMAIIGIGLLSIGMLSYSLGLHARFLEILSLILHPTEPIAPQAWTATDVYWTPFQHALTEFRVIARYLLAIAFPLPQLFVFDRWGLHVSTSITDPITTITSLWLIVGMVAFSVWQCRRLRLLSFGILWYFVGLSFESFVAVGSDLYFEHRNYLPVAGLFIGVAGQAVLLARAWVNTRTVWVLAIALALVLGGLTYWRNLVWKDSVALWTDTLQKSPGNVRAMLSLGNAYLDRSSFDEAKRLFGEALESSTVNSSVTMRSKAAYALGMLYLFERKPDEARKLLDSLSGAPASYHLVILQGYLAAMTGHLDEALSIYAEVLPKASRDDAIKIRTLIGDTYREMHLWDKAIAEYQKALDEDGSFAAAHYGVAVAYLATRRTGLAAEHLKTALILQPRNTLALAEMAELLLMTKSRVGDALTYAEKAVSLPSPFYQPSLTMGTVLIVIGREAEAQEYFAKAAAKGAPGYLVTFAKGRAYFLIGDNDKTRFYAEEFKKERNVPDPLRALFE